MTEEELTAAIRAHTETPYTFMLDRRPDIFRKHDVFFFTVNGVHVPPMIVRTPLRDATALALEQTLDTANLLRDVLVRLECVEAERDDLLTELHASRNVIDALKARDTVQDLVGLAEEPVAV